MEDVDHTVLGYSLDYLTFALTFFLGCLTLARFPNANLVGQHGQVQFFMSIGYLAGALGHHAFPNRASSDNCANVYYYLCWAISYPAMSVSNLLWLKLDASRALFSSKQELAPLTTTALLIMVCHVVTNVMIVSGSMVCFLSVPHYSGVEDDCAVDHSTQPTCDKVVYIGELCYFIVWFVTFLYISVKHPPHSRIDSLLEWLQTVFLVGAPLQIILVYNILPYTSVWTKTGAELSELLGTAWTYKACVCANHVCIFLISGHMLRRESAGKKKK
ncbi:hypothetical protein TrST_g3689 [Triparma strigata]|uniref:Uncharacterized protein n=1 Tax=Triparma strigata TaxID=1606541 RepID=A0A9W6ZL21_9STRA|nr:hypothetical protein TrST_g3689 [Triparma strigata]